MSNISSTWIVLGVLVVLVVWIIMIYNGLVAMRQRVNQSFADIDVQLKQRSDLIPNLVETVKGYASHERGTLEAVVKARQTRFGEAGMLLSTTSSVTLLNYAAAVVLRALAEEAVVDGDLLERRLVQQ